MLALENKIIFVLGGARSGKSSFAEELALELGSPVTYVATAEARDPEMAERIRRHQSSRPAAWKTIEAPFELATAIRAAETDTIIVDCITLFLTNLLMRELGPGTESETPVVTPGLAEKIQAEIGDLIQAAQESAAVVILVSNEVGLGLVPPYLLGRFFRDLAGWANRELAAAADQVFLLTAGIAVELKELAISPRKVALKIKK